MQQHLEMFLDAYAESLSVAWAAKKSECTRKLLREAIAGDAAFREALAEARAIGAVAVECEATERAVACKPSAPGTAFVSATDEVLMALLRMHDSARFGVVEPGDDEHVAWWDPARAWLESQ
jgi:hypothetical protein